MDALSTSEIPGLSDPAPSCAANIVEAPFKSTVDVNAHTEFPAIPEFCCVKVCVTVLLLMLYIPNPAGVAIQIRLESAGSSNKSSTI